MGLEERPKPKPKPVIVKKKPPTRRPVAQLSQPARTVATAAPALTARATAPQSTAPVRSAADPYHNRVVATWWDGSTKVSNGFYRGYCTYRAAKRRPDIFPYTSETTQSRPFGGNAKAWLSNAQRA